MPCACCGGACCVKDCTNLCCNTVRWTLTAGGCDQGRVYTVDAEVQSNCYAYLLWTDWDCQNELTGRDCGEGTCEIQARVAVNCAGHNSDGDCLTACTLGEIEYSDGNPDGEAWSSNRNAQCDCPAAFSSLTADVVCDGGADQPTCTAAAERQCVPAASQAACESQNGEWKASATCADNPCGPKGYCCLQGYRHDAIYDCWQKGIGEADGLPPCAACSDLPNYNGMTPWGLPEAYDAASCSDCDEINKSIFGACCGTEDGCSFMSAYECNGPDGGSRFFPNVSCQQANCANNPFP